MTGDRSLTMTFGQVCDELQYPATTCRAMIREGKLPGPIDASLSPKRRRWSRAAVEAYANRGHLPGRPQLVTVDRQAAS